MRRALFTTLAAAALSVPALTVTPPAQAFLPGAISSFDLRYVAGSVHVAAGDVEEAAGVLDCGGALAPVTSALGADVFGGGCFDLSSFVGADFVLTAVDDLSPTPVSLFAGFDTDGDNCVGCVAGADNAFEGQTVIGGQITESFFDVFVRLASINDDGSVSLATTGTLHLDVFAPGDPANPCHHRGDPGQEKPCGHGFDDEVPYPYACLPTCDPAGS